MPTEISTAAAGPDVGARLVQWDGWARKLAYRYARLGALDPEELYADLVLEVLTCASTYDPSRGAFTTWVALVAYRVYQRAAVRHTRSISIVPRVTRLEGWGQNPETVEILAVTPDRTSPDPAYEAERHERQRLIRVALARLPRVQREAVRLRFWEPGTRLNHNGRRYLREALVALHESLMAPDDPDDPGGGVP